MGSEESQDPSMHTREYMEKMAVLSKEEELIRLRHTFKMIELKTERNSFAEAHAERMSEIRLKNANINRTFNNKEAEVQAKMERRAKRLAEKHT